MTDNMLNNGNKKLLLEKPVLEETDDKYKIEEELSIYDDILKNYPKTKTYIKQISLIYQVSKKTLEKFVNARMIIEHHFKDIYQENIIYGINQCFRFNKSRPSPAQVVAMITGDSIANLKHKELEKNKNEKTEFEKYKEASEKYKQLRQDAIYNYKTNNTIRKQLNTDTYNKANYNISSTPLEVLDEIMIDYISIQAHILSFGVLRLNGYGIGISSRLSKIFLNRSNKSDKTYNDYTRNTINTINTNNNSRNTNNCFTMYLRSNEYQEEVIRFGIVKTDVPKEFIEYLKELFINNR